MKKLAYTNSEGGVCIVVPAPKEHIEVILGPLTDAEYENHVWQKSVPLDAINVHEIEDEVIPIDREFRDAWIINDPKVGIEIDINKAKQIHIDKHLSDFKSLKEEYDLKVAIGEDVTEIEKEMSASKDAYNSLKALDVNAFESTDAAIASIKGIK